MNGKPSLWTYIRNYKFNSIFIRNFLVILLLLILPLACVHYLVYRYNDSVMNAEVSRSSLSELTRIRDTVDIIMDEIDSLTVRLGSDQDVEQFQRSAPVAYPLTYPAIERIRRIQRLLSLSLLTNPYIQSIQIYFAGNDFLIGDTYAGSPDRFEREWWRQYDPGSRDDRSSRIAVLKSLIALRHEDNESERNLQEVVLFRPLPTYGMGQKGVMAVSVGADQLDPLLKAHVPEQEIYIVDGEGRIVFTHDQALIREPVRNLHDGQFNAMPGDTYSEVVQSGGKATVVSAIPSKGRDWTFLSTVPLEQGGLSRSQLRSFIALLVVFGMASSLIIAFVISVKTYQPIRGILSLLESSPPAMRSRGKSSGSWNEMKYIASTIIQSREQKRELEEELERRYEMMSRAQAVALQAQINPHMLYNTLEAVNWKVIRLTGGKNEASAMIHALSRLLRLSLSTGDNIIPMRTEIEHARLYIEVQQMHYKDELEVIWKINEGILDYMTVRLTLQPIIENAIYHGIKPSGRPGVITITGYAGTHSVIIRIKDNGVGLSPALAERINQSFASPHIRESDHIGLSNVNQRIRLVFGEPFGLRIFGIEGQGTIVEMRLPKNK